MNESTSYQTALAFNFLHVLLTVAKHQAVAPRIRLSFPSTPLKLSSEKGRISHAIGLLTDVDHNSYNTLIKVILTMCRLCLSSMFTLFFYCIFFLSVPFFPLSLPGLTTKRVRLVKKRLSGQYKSAHIHSFSVPPPPSLSHLLLIFV
jgi:hypothetical protein